MCPSEHIQNRIKFGTTLNLGTANTILQFYFYFRLPKIKEYVDSHDPGATIIPFSGAFESKLIDLDDDGKKAYMEETKNST
jgi:hypothetical protein